MKASRQENTEVKEKVHQAHELGKEGEQLAVKYLEEQGYLILERNFRAGRHEIDIIAMKDDEIVMVEVKSRTDDNVIEPEEAVNHKKRHSLILAADSYIRQRKRNEQVRFDIITVLKKDAESELKHIENAFNVLSY